MLVPAKHRTEQRARVLRRRWQAIGIMLVLIATGWLIANHHHAEQRTSATIAVPHQPAPHPAQTEPEPAIEPAPARDVSWHIVDGMDLPVSQTAGPHCLTSTQASCYAHTADGVALAAAQLLVRTFPFTGPATFEPTISRQVTGAGAPALERLTKQTYDEDARTAGVRDGGPILSTDGWIAGYETEDTGTGNTSTVDVLVSQDGQDLGYTVFAVHLTWQGGDWRLIAPAWGDWRSDAHAVSAPSSSFRSYDNIGVSGAS